MRLVAVAALPPPVRLRHVRTLVVAGRPLPRAGERLAAVAVHRPAVALDRVGLPGQDGTKAAALPVRRLAAAARPPQLGRASRELRSRRAFALLLQLGMAPQDAYALVQEARSMASEDLIARIGSKPDALAAPAAAGTVKRARKRKRAPATEPSRTCAPPVPGSMSGYPVATPASGSGEFSATLSETSPG